MITIDQSMYGFVLLSLIGNILVIKKNWIGYVLWLITNSAWILYNIYLQIYSQAVLFTIYNILALYGIYIWRFQKKQ